MNGQMEYVLNDCERMILLLRSAGESEQDEMLDKLSKNMSEINRIWLEKTAN